MKHFVLDVETGGYDANSIVFTGAICVMDFNDMVGADVLCERALFVEFDVNEQKALGRTYDIDCLKWWKTTSDEVKRVNIPTNKKQYDMSVSESLNAIRKYIKTHSQNEPYKVWTSTHIPNLVLTSLCNNLALPNVVKYANWVHIPTAIYLLADETYIDGDTSQSNILLTKHNPVHDVVANILTMYQLIGGLS
jgi:hypothetical protein